MPAGVVNGKSIAGPLRAQVVDLLAQGFSPYFIAKRLHRDRATIAAVRDAEFIEVQRRKPILAAQAERGALEAGEKIVEAVRNGDIKGAALIPAYGVFVDKSLSLRGDAIATIKHLHTHRMSQDDVYAFALERSKQANVVEAQVVDSPPLLANGDVYQNEAALAPISDQLASKRDQMVSKRGQRATGTHSNPDARARKKRRRRPVSADPSLRKKSE